MMTSNTLFKAATRCLIALAMGLASAAHAVDMMQTRMVSMTSLAAPQLAATTSSLAAPQLAATNALIVEGVAFTGLATLKSRLAFDPDGDTKLIVSIDLSNMSATGIRSAAKYELWSHDVLILPLAASHQVEITFPYSKNNKDQVAAVRTGVARFALNVDTATGTITSASATIASR
jgi:PhoPQ-activated pathogenicity-related protein